MSRLKLKYSKSEIVNDLYTFGNEWMTSDKQEYKGLYHRYTLTNETYTDATWNESTSKPLFPLVREPKIVQEYNNIKKIKSTYESIVTSPVTITPADIKLGYIFRYFLKKINEPIYIEISKTQFDDYQSKLDINLYASAQCQWYISGPKETISKPVKKPGVIELNTKAIAELQKTLPGISQKLTNPLQFYTDTDYAVPRDINLG